MSKLISIKAIIVKDSETCSNDFIMGVLRGLDISDDNIKLGAGDIKVELKDKSFGEIFNIHDRLKKNFNCFCIKVFWNDGRVQLLEEYFKEEKEHRSKNHRGNPMSQNKKEIDNLKLEIQRYKIINAEIGRINEKLNKSREIKINKNKSDFILQEIKEEMELIDARMRLLQETVKELLD